MAEEEEQPLPTSFLRRPEHVVKCAVGECKTLGFRTDACPVCREYRCPEHVNEPIQGNQADPEGMVLLDPKGGVPPAVSLAPMGTVGWQAAIQVSSRRR